MLGVAVQSAISSIRSSKVRTLLTTIGVIIGVIFFVLISATVDGLDSEVRTEIESLGGNLVIVVPGNAVDRDEDGEVVGFNIVAALGTSTLSEKDLNDVSKIKDVKATAPLMIVSGLVEREEMQSKDSPIIATTSDFPAALNQKIAEGKFFSKDSDSRVAVVGSNIVKNLFAGTVSLGSSINVRGQPFAIVGVMEESTVEGLNLGPDIDDAVFIPFEAGKKINGGTGLIQRIYLQLGTEADADTATENMKKVLLKNHGGQEDFSIIKQDEIIDLSSSIFSIIKNFSNIVSLIIMIIGGIVILLVMMMTVKERTREIGLRKAVGATNLDILTQFIVETVVITWFGAIVGIATAAIISVSIGFLTELTPIITLSTVLVAFGLATLFGLLGGLIPAFFAAFKDPIEALRHE